MSCIVNSFVPDLTSSSYQFDKVGNITNKTTDLEPTSYDYDKTYQLINATKPQGPESFNYDKTGNRTLSGYSHNANNELKTAGGAEYTYDANGNTVTKTEGYETTIFTYDASDRLTQVTLPSGFTATYSYDPFGRRVKKELAGEVTYYAYADEGLIGEYDAAGIQKKSYGWLPNGIWGTNPVFMTQGANTYYYQNDHLGTPQRLIDESGTTVWQASYQAFGKATVDSSSTIESNLRFPGQYFDKETELHYNWNRYYNTETGRYTQVDPLGFGAKDINFYSYVRNRTANKMDPFGLYNLEMMADGFQDMAIGVLGVGLAVTAAPTGVGLVVLVPAVIVGTTAFVEGSVSFIVGALQDNKCEMPKSSLTWNAMYILSHSKRVASLADNTVDVGMAWSGGKAAAITDKAAELIWWLVDIAKSHGKAAIDLLKPDNVKTK